MRIERAFEAKVVTNGNSLAINIPAYVVRDCKILKGDTVEIQLHTNIVKLEQPVYDMLQQQIDQIITEHPELKEMDNTLIGEYLIAATGSNQNLDSVIKSRVKNLERRAKLLHIHRVLAK